MPFYNHIHCPSGVLDNEQWMMLYPAKKKNDAKCDTFDFGLLLLLLKSICHLSPPYPNGWSEMPLTTDKALSADLARLTSITSKIYNLVSIGICEKLEKETNIWFASSCHKTILHYWLLDDQPCVSMGLIVSNIRHRFFLLGCSSLWFDVSWCVRILKWVMYCIYGSKLR